MAILNRRGLNPIGEPIIKGMLSNLLGQLVDGVIHNIFYSSCLGWIVELKTDEHGLFFGYCHLSCQKHGVNCDGSDHSDGSNCNKNIQKGDKVEAGQPIGLCGNTGTCSRGVHLHLTASKKPDPRYAKTFDAEKFINQKIKKQEKESNAIRKQEEQRKEKIEATESTQTVEECLPDVTTPEKGETLPARILEAVRVILLWLKK